MFKIKIFGRNEKYIVNGWQLAVDEAMQLSKIEVKEKIIDREERKALKNDPYYDLTDCRAYNVRILATNLRIDRVDQQDVRLIKAYRRVFEDEVRPFLD